MGLLNNKEIKKIEKISGQKYGTCIKVNEYATNYYFSSMIILVDTMVRLGGYIEQLNNVWLTEKQIKDIKEVLENL